MVQFRLEEQMNIAELVAIDDANEVPLFEPLAEEIASSMPGMDI